MVRMWRLLGCVSPAHGLPRAQSHDYIEAQSHVCYPYEAQLIYNQLSTVTYLISERATQASGPLEKHTKIAKKQLLITLLTINRIALFLYYSFKYSMRHLPLNLKVI